MTIRTDRDAFGIPHLRADSALELSFAQGRNVAIDRAFQLELERHRSQGSSASFLGGEAVAWDRFARQSRLDDTARRCFARLDLDTREFVCAFVDGVNAGLMEGAHAAPEFASLSLRPGRWEPWTPLGIWLSTHILFAGFPSKLWREEVAIELGEGALELFTCEGPVSTGSNGWLLSGARTVHGKAILAGDPHRFLEDPGVYQQVQLSCPEFDVLGLAVPGVPGIAHFGHTGHVAWAITNAMADYQDLYHEQLRWRDGELEARGPDGFRAASHHEETIEVRGAAPLTVSVIETERGPVVAGGVDEPFAISLRTWPRAEGALGFAALPRLLRARTVADVDRALEYWVEPVNVVQAADTEGGLLHRVVGVVPKRARANMLRVVPAWEREHTWRGVHELPRAEVDGAAVMANERGLAASLGVEFAPPHRARRIRELLRARPRWQALDLAAVHMDTQLASARPLLDHLAALQGLEGKAALLRDRLLAWDGHMAEHSTEAADFARVRAELVRRLSDHPSFASLSILPSRGPRRYPELFWPWLALVPRVGFALEALLCGHELPHGQRLALVRASLEHVASASTRDVTWGELHRLAPWQAVARSDDTWPGLSGDHDCVNATGSIPGLTHHCLRGPAARFVWDLARRDDSLWVVPLGASGVPGHPHHRDQLPLWQRGELVPVVSDFARLREEPQVSTHAASPRAPVFARWVPQFGQVRIVPVHPAHDIDLIDAWVKQERAQFWGMREHSRETVRDIYEHLDSLDSHHAYLLWRDHEPVALMQTYRPEADPIGECYAREPGDLGVHVLIAPVRGTRQAGFTGQLLSVFLEFVLEDPAVQRVVAEPHLHNQAAIARLLRSGFVLGPRVQLPEKPAQLAFLQRGRSRQH